MRLHFCTRNGRRQSENGYLLIVPIPCFITTVLSKPIFPILVGVLFFLSPSMHCVRAENTKYHLHMGYDKASSINLRENDSQKIPLPSSDIPLSNPPYPRGGSRGEKTGVQVLHNSPTNSNSSPLGKIRHIRRQKRRVQIAARLSLLIASPFLVLAFLLSSVVSVLLSTLNVLTFTLLFRDHAALSLQISRLFLCSVFAGVIGSVLSPTFAAFGLLAVIFDAAADIVVPLFRIVYRRQIRKINHLMTLAKDPVLMETLTAISGAAEGMSKKIGETTRGVGRKGARYLSDTEKVIEYMSDRVGESTAVRSIAESLPDSVSSWAMQQISSLRSSGTLDAAVTRALSSARQQVGGMERALPYLRAIEKVYQEEEEKTQKALVMVEKGKVG